MGWTPFLLLLLACGAFAQINRTGRTPGRFGNGGSTGNGNTPAGSGVGSNTGNGNGNGNGPKNYTAASAGPGNKGRTCATPHPYDPGSTASARSLRELERMGITTSPKFPDIDGTMPKAFFTAGMKHGLGRRNLASTLTIYVYWHVINVGLSIFDGNLQDSDIRAQIKVLDDSYKAYGFTFVLAAIDRTTSYDWFSPWDYQTDQLNYAQMGTQLRKGRASDLNVYSYLPANNILGVSSWPWEYRTNPKQDGVRILFSTVPGGWAYPYDEGKTLVHEVGHWLGLYHTFMSYDWGSDGCSVSLSDRVLDTSAQRSPTFGCPSSRDSCPDLPGQDPISNYMDYSDDSCMDEFTKGQADRMYRMFAAYRYNK